MYLNPFYRFLFIHSVDVYGEPIYEATRLSIMEGTKVSSAKANTCTLELIRDYTARSITQIESEWALKGVVQASANVPLLFQI